MEIDNWNYNDEEVVEDIKKIESLIEETNQKFKKKKKLTNSMVDQFYIYFESYDEMKKKIEILINNYLNIPEVLSYLLDLYDKMEKIIETYNKLSLEEEKYILEDPNSLNNKEELDIIQNIHIMNNEENKNEYNPINTNSFECPICIEEVEPGNGYIFEECSHSYCINCLKSYLKNLINEGRVLDIKCPTPKCGTGIDYYQIKNFLDEETFSKYEEFNFLMTLKSDPSVRWCPNPKGCGNAMCREQGNTNNKAVCDKCNFEFCFECCEEWHSGTCEEYQQWKIENKKTDIKFSEWTKNNNTKKCPKCKIIIQKNDGCNHMTCTHCNYQFCWLCGGKYSDNHFSILNPLGCPGMQFKNDKRVNKGKLIAKKVGIGTGIVLTLPILIPAAIIGGSIYGGYRLHRWKKYHY
jgi:hypothetical protein